MFRLHRHKPYKSGERFDFKFSNFQASQVPKGWDKLFVSIVSVETGKTVAKSSKALVRNGNCQWTETLSESIWVSQYEASKELEESIYKLVVAMGSARSGILGEATINLTGYMSKRASVPVSLPLKKCNHGTTLQVKIQCLTPRTFARDEQWKDTNSQGEDMAADCEEIDMRSVGSSSSNRLGSTSYPGETGSQNTSFSASGSRHSSDSAEGLIGREKFSPQNILNGGVYNQIRRQDSTDSQNSVLSGNSLGDDPSRSNHSSFNSRMTISGSQLRNTSKELGQSSSHAITTSSLKTTDSSKVLLEAAEDSIEELRAEATMWERNARKLMLDLEILKKEFSEQSRNQANLDMELSAACTERDSLKKEIENLKILLKEPLVKQTIAADSNFQANGMTNIQKELESELKFQQESNSNLALQLRKTQESNIELVSVLQELEETIEKQKLELDNLSAQKSKFDHMENSAYSDLEGTDSDKAIKKSDEKFEAEDKRGLELQLQQLQDSQKILQDTVKFLENKLEDKNHEIETERRLKVQNFLDIEAEWSHKLSAKEKEITKLEAKLSESCSVQRLDHDPNVTEIEALKAKIQELESDCNELTDENLELLYKLKESNKFPLSGVTSFYSSSTEFPTDVSANNSKSEVCKPEKELQKKERISEGVASSHLQVQLIDVENKCTNLELQLQSYKDKANSLDAELHRRQAQVEEKEMKIASLQKLLERYQIKETDGKDQLINGCRSHAAIEEYKIYSKVVKELQEALARVRKPWSNIFPHTNIGCEYNFDNLEDLNNADLSNEKGQAEAILDYLVGLNKLLEARFIDCEEALQCSAVESQEKAIVFNEVQKKLEDYKLKENMLYLSIQELERSNTELEAEVADLNKELDARKTQIGKLEASLLMKEDESAIQMNRQREFEAQVSTLQKEKSQLEENMELVLRESSINSKCLDDLQNELMLLSSSMDSHVSANKVLERKSSDLEVSKHELELHLTELEKENVKLSERISGLEAQLRYLTDERESNRLKLENSESLAMNLKEEIRRLGIEMETQKLDLKQKLQDMQNRWTEAQEESEYLKKANTKLQATAESLIEECNALQMSNGELRKQNQVLHEHCTQLEAKLRESQHSLSDCSKRVEVLEAKLSSMEKDIALKEELLTSELNALLDENKEHKEKIILGESMLNQMYLEKTVEVENLHREVVHLMEQISATHGERERIASDAVLEVSNLRADKAKLETALQEVQARFKLSENKLYTLLTESAEKVQGLMGELAASKQSHELLMADHGKLLTLFEDVKSGEEKFKNTVNRLELELSASEYERHQLEEEIAAQKNQLRKITHLQDEVLALKNSLNETKFEKEKLEASLQLLSGDCQELKAEKTSFIEKISSLQKAASELEDCRRTRIVLEEKLLRLEGDLSAREALCAQDAELKNELGRIKRANRQFQQKTKHLEEEKDEWMKRAHVLEEEQKLRNEKEKCRIASTNNYFCSFPESIREDFKISENEMEKNVDQHSVYQRMPSVRSDQLRKLRNAMQNHDIGQYVREGDEQLLHNGSSQGTGVDPSSKIQLRENELAVALEANNMNKVQSKRLVSEEQNNVDGSKKSTAKDEVPKKEVYGLNASLEAELRDLRERYFHMSLKYAEVEAQREELVMKLKSVKSDKKWFAFS